MSKLDDKKKAIKETAEGSLEYFIKLVHPMRVLGGIHEEVISWWLRDDAKSHQLLLLPRDHAKSALAAYRVAWEITRNPTIRVLYISSTSNLATKQLKFIKDILTSKIYKFYWPEMVNDEEGKREKWTETEIAVDHPARKAEAVRDPTVFTAGLTTSITGMHCDISVLDDVVVQENAYTEEGREKVRQQFSLLSSIEGADAKQIVVGTRYHPKDLYNDMMETQVEIFGDDGEIEESEPLYEIFERVVETNGEFLWPRQQRYDGKWFGFDEKILARKRAQYVDQTLFRAQYYNNPNFIGGASINPDYFQYYDRGMINRYEGKWMFNGRRLNVFASMDFAFSLNRRSDFTAVVVVGVDSDNNYYVLDIARFKTDKISEYFKEILRLHQKWDFRKIRCEVTAAQSVIVEDLKTNYIRTHGLSLAIDEHRPTRHEGTKEERNEAVLQPRYANKQMWHYKGGNCQVLEEELVMSKPPHDDVKDALASCIGICVAPSRIHHSSKERMKFDTHHRFGGVI